MSGPPLPDTVVIDTNVVLDLWLFRDPRCRALADALASKSVCWIASAAMRDELEHVLLRAPFPERWPADPKAVRSGWERHAITVDAAPIRLVGPVCRDPDDQKFIDLALARRSRWLLTRDRALLKLARAAARFGTAVITPERFGSGEKNQIAVPDEHLVRSQ